MITVLLSHCWRGFRINIQDASRSSVNYAHMNCDELYPEFSINSRSVKAALPTSLLDHWNKWNDADEIPPDDHRRINVTTTESFHYRLGMAFVSFQHNMLLFVRQTFNAPHTRQE